MARSASDVVRSNLERGNGTPPAVVRGQTAQPRGRAKAGKPGTSHQRPHSEQGRSQPNTSGR